MITLPHQKQTSFNGEYMSKNIRVTKTHLVIELTSKHGHKYEVGYPIDSGYTEKDIVDLQSEQLKADRVFLTVDWVPGAPRTSPSGEVQKLGIKEGYVSQDRGVVYEYRINFENSKGWGFYFKDQSDDVYHCVTIKNGWHYIDYNSDKATIIGVAN